MTRSVHDVETDTQVAEVSAKGRTDEKTDRQRRRSEESDGREHTEDAGESGQRGGGKRDEKAEEKAETFRPSRRAIFIGILVLAVVIIVSLVLWLHARHFVKTDDAYTAGHVHQISARISGVVDAVLVDDNQAVKANDVLVRLDPRDYDVILQKARSGLQQAKAQRTQAEAKIAQSQAQRSGTEAEAAQAQTQVSQARAQLERARNDYERIAGLYSKDIKAVSKADVDAATEAFDRARSALEGAQANLTGAHAQAEAAAANVKAAEAEAEVAAANIVTGEAQVRDAELQRSYCNVVAPVAGKVSKKTVEEGQRLQPGQALMAVVPENIWVVANLKETQLKRLQVGQRVDIKIDTLPDQTFFGSVDSIQEGSGATLPRVIRLAPSRQRCAVAA